MVNGPEALPWLRLIPLLPGAAAMIHGIGLAVLRRPMSRGAVVTISCGSVMASFLLSFWALIELILRPADERVLVDGVYTWIGAGEFSAELGFLLDPLSAVMLLVVSGVGSLIHVYSVGYMDEDRRDDKGFQRFFCFLNLFTFSMLLLVLADNLLLMFVGWEGVGLCSYLLIGFWYGDRFHAYCGSKAFIVNRIADVGFLVGTFLVFWSLAAVGHASVAFLSMEAAFPLLAEELVTLPSWLQFLPGAPQWKLATLIGLAFFLAAAGKSAQFPLHVWLPDAMAGPTPVSALIHAATMVTAGVYLVCRLSFVFALAPGASWLIAWVGGLTALLAAGAALAQTDIKKVLAWSTVSQLGTMFLAVGCGAWSAAMFHVVTHAFFKALLFLGAGAVILALHHEQDLRRMGGLRPHLPWVYWTMFAGVIGISAVPWVSAGFFSKDGILLAAYLAEEVPGNGMLWLLGVVTGGLTAFYTFRLFFLTFLGTPRMPRQTLQLIREPGWVIVVPLLVLAVLSILGGYLGPSEAFVAIEDANSFANFLRPVFESAAAGAVTEGPIVSHGTEWALAMGTFAVAALGIFLAWLLYERRPALPGRIAGVLPVTARLLGAQYYLDTVYDAAIVRPLVFLADRVLYRALDSAGIDDASVNGAGRAVRGVAAHGLKYLHSGLTQSYLVTMVVGSAALVLWLVVGG